MTRAIAQLKTISEKDSETEKHDPAAEAGLRSAVQAGLEPFLAELEQSIGFFQNETGVELKTVHVSGGGALAAGVCPIFSEYLGIQFSLWNYNSRLQLSDSVDLDHFRKHPAQFTVALGLAAR